MEGEGKRKRSAAWTKRSPHLKAETVRQYRCPKCGARPGEPCYSFGSHTVRDRHHVERVKHAMSEVGRSGAMRSRRSSGSAG